MKLLAVLAFVLLLAVVIALVRGIHRVNQYEQVLDRIFEEDA